VTQTRRRRGSAQRGADAIMGYLIPFAFIGIAVYQQMTEGEIDKYVIGVLLIFGLGALGWRIDLIFEAYMRARYQMPAPTPGAKEEKDVNDDGK